MNYHIYRLEKYLELSFRMWSIILFYIDKQKIENIFNSININSIIQNINFEFKDNILNFNCLVLITKIKIIHEILNLYAVNYFNVYMFFELSNIIKISNNSSDNLLKINLAENLFKNISFDNLYCNNKLLVINNIVQSDNEINNIRNKIGYTNLQNIYTNFYKLKTEIFENEFKNIFNNII